MARPDRSRKPYSRPDPESRPTGSDGAWLHDKAPGRGNTVTRPGKGGVARAPSGPNAMTNTKLIVSNLHYEITPQELITIFAQIGTLTREPVIKYDRSGRSTGEAVVVFDTPAEATRAKKQFDGILAKGQPMTVKYDTAAPPIRRSVSAPTTTSLLARIEKTPLAERLTSDDAAKKDKAKKDGSGPGPIRTKNKGKTATGASKDSVPAGKREKKKPATAEDLDAELDAYLGDGSSAVPAAAAAVAPTTEGDVDMV